MLRKGRNVLILVGGGGGRVTGKRPGKCPTFLSHNHVPNVLSAGMPCNAYSLGCAAVLHAQIEQHVLLKAL